MQTRRTVVSLMILAVCLMVAAPGIAQDTQPAPKSYVAIDANGGIIECFDFNNKGVVWAWANDRKGNFQSMDISSYTGTPADSLYWGQIQNVIYEGLLVSKIQFTGTCEQQGGAWWGFIPSWGNASCSVTTFMRAGNDRVNSSGTMIQVGPLFKNCTGLFGGDAKIQKGTRKDK